MTANPSLTRIWRSQYLPSIELVHGAYKRHSLPRHFHEELELGIMQGDGWQLNYRDASYSVPANTLVITQPGEAHSADCNSTQDCTFRAIRVSTELLQQVAIGVAGHHAAMPVFPLPLISNCNLNAQIVQVHRSLERAKSQLEQQSLTLDLLAQLILRYAEAPPSLAKIGKERQPVDLVRDYLEDHYNQEIALEQLAQIANLSSFYLNRSFCQTFGMPPHTYQIQVRVLRAKQLLRKNWSIQRVAIKTGFASQSHFGSHFKRLVHVTPKRYLQDSKNVISFKA